MRVDRDRAAWWRRLHGPIFFSISHLFNLYCKHISVAPRVREVLYITHTRALSGANGGWFRGPSVRSSHHAHPRDKTWGEKKRYGWQGQVMGLLMGTRSTDMFAWEQSKRFHGFDVNFRGIRLRGVCLLCRQLELASLRVNNRNNSNKFVACVQ
jgi:hypothetical protein